MIRKRKNTLANGKVRTTYQAVVYFKGKVVSRKTFDTKAQAVQFESEALKKCKLGKLGLNEGFTFGMCVEGYFNSDFKQLQQTSQRSLEFMFSYLRNAPIYRELMEDFTDRTIDSFIDWLLKHPTAENPRRKSFSHELSFMCVILNWFRENKDSSFSPPILKRHRKKCKFKEVEQRVPNYYIDPKRVIPFLEHIKRNSKDPVYYRLALFMVITGCRVGEAAGLCWDYVCLDGDRPFVQIMRTRDWNAKKDGPKFKKSVKTNTSRRTINIPSAIVNELKKIEMIKFGEFSPVFYNRRLMTVPSYVAISNIFSKAYEALDLKFSGSHILRHSAGTFALMAGKDLAVVQAMLGHANINQTQHYAKVVALQNNSAPHQTAELLGLE